METAAGTGRNLSKILKRYLGQYVRAIKRRHQLEARLRSVCREMDRPIGGINYSPVNISSSGVSAGSAAFTLRKSEIESRISDQKKEIEANLLKIMDILDYLDPDSDERMILELKYIDNCGWREIEKRASMSRSSCFNCWNNGIKNLLGYKRVYKIVEEYAEKTGF